MLFADMDRIVFAGDSVTDAGSTTPVGEGLFDNLGHGYVRVIENVLSALYPEVHLRITNSGVFGNTSRDLLARWERDVRSLNPQWVSICIGFNDVWSQFHSPTIPDNHISVEAYRENVRRMILSEKPHVKGIFLMSPYVMQSDRTDAMRAMMDAYGAVCRELAEEYDCIYVDLQAVMDAYLRTRSAYTLSWDFVHPNQVGATCIALAWLHMAQATRLDVDALKMAIDRFADGERIVFAGDSVTDMGSVKPVGEGLDDNLGQGYVRVLDNFISAICPEKRIRITNSGVSGDTSRDLLARWERDVHALDPQWLSICIGINDVWRQFDSPAMLDHQVQPEEYRENVRKMILAEKDRVKGIFLMTPYYIEPNPSDAMRARMDEYGTICRELAEEYGCIFVDLQEMFTAFCQIRHSSYLAWDRVHPNKIGATCIALKWLAHCQKETENA